MGGPSTLLSYSCSQVSFDHHFDDNHADDGSDDNCDLESFIGDGHVKFLLSCQTETFLPLDINIT